MQIYGRERPCRGYAAAPATECLDAPVAGAGVGDGARGGTGDGAGGRAVGGEGGSWFGSGSCCSPETIFGVVEKIRPLVRSTFCLYEKKWGVIRSSGACFGAVKKKRPPP